MRIIAAIEADLDRSAIGTASRLGEDLCGQPVLRRTVTRLQRAGRLGGCFVLCRPAERTRVADLCDGLQVRVETHDAPSPPCRQLVHVSRKWALDAWRGGIGGTCWFDECVHPPLLYGLAQRERADAVLTAPAAAALIDPVLVDRMIAHYGAVAQATRMVFSQAPPGLGPIIFATELLAQLNQNHIPPGFALAYRPDEPQVDMIVKDCCYKAPAPIIHTAGRFIADCDRGVARVTAAIESANGNGEHLNALAVCQWARKNYLKHLELLPQEVEMELTTEDQLSATTLRPRGPAVGKRGPIDLALVQRLAEELARFDDSLVVLGGFGEPLLHPQFAEILHCLRATGVFGLAVRTNAIALDAAAIEAICQAHVDVVTVLLDAASPELYRTVHQADRFDQVQANIEALLSARHQRGQPGPLIVPEMVKDQNTLGEMETFFDHWTRRLGWALIDGYSHYAKQLPDRCVVNMAPPVRVPCRRIFSRCAVLADGSVLACDRDFSARHAVGSLASAGLADLWQGPAMQQLRSDHLNAQYDRHPLCRNCHDWDRP